MFYYKKINSKSTLKLKESIEKYQDIDASLYEEITKEQHDNIIENWKHRQPAPKSATRIKTERIEELKSLLQDTDYQAIKYAEGLITEEEYAPIKLQRQEWRDEINQLEEELQQ